MLDPIHDPGSIVRFPYAEIKKVPVKRGHELARKVNRDVLKRKTRLRKALGDHLEHADERLGRRPEQGLARTDGLENVGWLEGDEQSKNQNLGVDRTGKHQVRGDPVPRHAERMDPFEKTPDEKENMLLGRQRIQLLETAEENKKNSKQ